jgi:Icc-related predicted phosphoesterase
MNVLAFSDWRSQPVKDLQWTATQLDLEIDFIVYAGDDLERFLDDDTNHFDELARELNADVGFVRGNDDVPASFGQPIETDRVHDLHRGPYEIGEHVFLGQEGAIGETALGLTVHEEADVESHLRELYEGYANRQVVLVTHTPPHGWLDIGRRFGEQRLGSHAVRTFAEDIEPVLTVCGHVHQFGGKDVECTFGTVLNIASHDHDGAEGRFALIEFSEHGVSITHRTTDAYLADSLTKLTRVGDATAENLRAAGFDKLNDLTSERRTELLAVSNIGESTVDRILGHATAYRRDEPVVTSSEPFARLRERNPIVVDIETNLAQDCIWLIGAYDYSTESFVQFFDPDDEAAVCSNFIDYLNNRDDPTVAYYAGQGFDEKTLIRRSEAHGVALEEVVGEWTDVCLAARRGVFVPAEGHDLSTVAGGLGFEFEYPEISGFDVGAAYSAYISDNEAPDWGQYREYNREDVLATTHIIDTAASW